MKQSPIIGVTPLWDTERKSVWMLPDYLDGIRAAGGIPVVLPLEMSEADADRIVETCDGFLFTGGQDKWEDAEGHLFVSLNLVYQSTEQLRNMTLLDLENPPMVYPLRLKGLDTNADGLYPYEALVKRFGDKL